MKKAKLQYLSKIISTANIFAIKHDSVCELMNFNESISIEKFQNYLEEISSKAYFSFSENLTKIAGDPSTYINSIKRQFKNLLSLFFEEDGYLLHQKLKIFDPSDTPIPFNELSDNVKQKISTYITVQKGCLLCFLSKIDPSDTIILPSGYKWDHAKTCAVELLNVLFISKAIISQKGPVSKKEFMKDFGTILNIDLDNWEKILSKSMLRENPAQFIDLLKTTILEYCSKNDNIING